MGHSPRTPCTPWAKVVAGAALAFACLTISLAPSVAFADESAAEAFFVEGINAMKRSDYPVACDAFAKSNKADPAPGTQINLALCFEKQKKWASAWTWYRSAFGLAQQRGQKEREQLADESATRIQPFIHYIIVSVKEPLTDMIVRRDGNEVATMVGGREIPLPVDPGPHTLEVSAKDKKTWTHPFTVPDTPATDTIEVPKLVDDERPVTATKPEGSPAPLSSSGSGQKVAGIIIGGAGLLSAVGSVVFFLLAENQESERDKRYAESVAAPVERRGELQRSAKSFHDAAKKDELIAFSMLGGAGVLVGVGALLYFTAPKGPKATGAHVMPMLSPNHAGVGLGGTF